MAETASNLADVRKATPAIWLRSIVFAMIFYVVTAVFLILGAWLLLAPRRWAMAGLDLHARTILVLLKWICGIDYEVRGRHNIPKGPCLVIAKHQSAWDTFALIPLFRDPAMVLKDELKWIPFYGWFCIKFEHIRVRRDKASAALKSLITTARQRIGDGREIVIFPEGTRTAPGAAPDYKPGYVALYEALDVPAVPLALNSGLFWPRRTLLRFPGTVVIECLTAVPPGMPRKAFRTTVEDAIETASRKLFEEARTSEPALRQSSTVDQT